MVSSAALRSRADHGIAPFENVADTGPPGVEKVNQPRIFDRLDDDGFARIAFVRALITPGD
jgi:hypothetical protein